MNRPSLLAFYLRTLNPRRTGASRWQAVREIGGFIVGGVIFAVLVYLFILGLLVTGDLLIAHPR